MPGSDKGTAEIETVHAQYFEVSASWELKFDFGLNELKRLPLVRDRDLYSPHQHNAMEDEWSCELLNWAPYSVELAFQTLPAFKSGLVLPHPR